MKPSEIIRMAMNHPSYLNGNDYLCHVIKDELVLNDDCKDAASVVIYDSIRTRKHSHTALESYLWEVGKSLMS